MRFFVKYLFLLPPILAIGMFFGAYFLIKNDNRTVPRYVPKHHDDTWSAEEYIRHLNLKPFNERELHRLLLRRTRQKEGVYLESLLPALDTAAIEVVYCYHQVMGDEYIPVITSGNDYPYHARTSKHYQNAAIDFRIKNMPVEQRRQVFEMTKNRLGERFNVLWEKGDAEHLHIELTDVPE